MEHMEILGMTGTTLRATGSNWEKLGMKVHAGSDWEILGMSEIILGATGTILG